MMCKLNIKKSKTDNFLNSIYSKISHESVLLFDMDGTLVETDYANFLAYKNAIKTVLGFDIEYENKIRFNRAYIKKALKGISFQEYNNILKLKENNYLRYLSKTKLIKNNCLVLNKYHSTHSTILITKSRKQRALATLKYHNLQSKFDHTLFAKDFILESGKCKVKIAVESLNLDIDNILVFENDPQEFKDAIEQGIPTNNIILI